jgi:AcrR family transcriptional regulator
VVAASAELFDRSGFSSVTMEDIAAEIGVAKASLYHYFTSKDDILVSIHEEFIDLLHERHRERLQIGFGPEQLLLEIMADILELMETHHGHVRVFFEHHRELPVEARRRIRVKREDYETAVTEIIRRGVNEQVFRPCDPHLAALAVFGMCNWAYQWLRPNGDLRPRQIAYQFYGYLIQGLGNPQRRDHAAAES